MWNNFSQKDFDKASPPCKIGQMSVPFMDKIQKARDISGIPYVVLSAYRSLEHEYSMGRKGTSSHPKGVALDIRFLSSREYGLIRKGLYLAGFTRIGINFKSKFIHVDDDTNKPLNVLWTY